MLCSVIDGGVMRVNVGRGGDRECTCICTVEVIVDDGGDRDFSGGIVGAFLLLSSKIW